jgi:hypothetical protein
MNYFKLPSEEYLKINLTYIKLICYFLNNIFLHFIPWKKISLFYDYLFNIIQN